MNISEWIPVSERLPDENLVVEGLVVGRTYELYMASNGLFYSVEGLEYRPTHWRPFPSRVPLPNPLPRESSRDRWWKSLATVDTAGEVRFVVEDGSISDVVNKRTAFAIWDIAIAASKRDDFVP